MLTTETLTNILHGVYENIPGHPSNIDVYEKRLVDKLCRSTDLSKRCSILKKKEVLNLFLDKDEETGVLTTFYNKGLELIPDKTKATPDKCIMLGMYHHFDNVNKRMESDNMDMDCEIKPSLEYDNDTLCPPFYRLNKNTMCCFKSKGKQKIKAALNVVGFSLFRRLRKEHLLSESLSNKILNSIHVETPNQKKNAEWKLAESQLKAYLDTIPQRNHVFILTFLTEMKLKLKVWVMKNLITTQEERDRLSKSDWFSRNTIMWLLNTVKDSTVKLSYWLITHPMWLLVVSRALMYYKQKVCRELAVEKQQYELVSSLKEVVDHNVSDVSELAGQTSIALMGFLMNTTIVETTLKTITIWISFTPVGPMIQPISDLLIDVGTEIIRAYVHLLVLKTGMKNVLSYFIESCPPVLVHDVVVPADIGKKVFDNDTFIGWLGNVLQPQPGTAAFLQTAGELGAKMGTMSLKESAWTWHSDSPPNTITEPGAIHMWKQFRKEYNQQQNTEKRSMVPLPPDVF